MVRHQPQYFKLFSSNPLAIIKKAILIMVAGIFIGLLIPWLAALKSGVLTNKDVELKLLKIKKLQTVGIAIKATKDDADSIAFIIKKINTSIIRTDVSFKDANDLLSLLNIRSALLGDLNNKKPIYKAGGFLESGTLFLWPTVLICLSWLLFILSPSVNSPKTLSSKYISTLIIIYLLYRGPVILRNVIGSDIGRVFYGHANLDVDPIGFYVQELLGVLVTLLITLIWIKWTAIILLYRKRVPFAINNSIEAVFNKKNLEVVSYTFFHWQICSIVLATAFIGYSYLYWNLIYVYGDGRYIFTGIIIHLLWLLTWILITLPLLIVWNSWQALKAQAIYNTVNSIQNYDLDMNSFIVAINDLHPIGFINLIFSGIGVFVSFIIPVVQLLIK